MNDQGYSEMALPALQGSSLLGFLAALGAFRTLADSYEPGDVRLRWSSAGASFTAILELRALLAPAQVVQRLLDALRELAGHYCITVEKDLKIPRPTFRKLANRASEDFLTHSDNIAAGLVSAFG